VVRERSASKIAAGANEYVTNPERKREQDRYYDPARERLWREYGRRYRAANRERSEGKRPTARLTGSNP
jgi:hypothetical protein